LLAFFANDAIAQTVDWRSGTAVVRKANGTCRQNGTFVGDAYNARYRHAGLGDNGDRARISLTSRRTAHHISTNGDFTKTFQVADIAVFIGGGVVSHTTPAPNGPYAPSIRMTRRTPNNIDETTNQIRLYLKIQDFFVGPGITGCNIDLEVTLLQ
jgi:hypothetical protein